MKRTNVEGKSNYISMKIEPNGRIPLARMIIFGSINLKKHVLSLRFDSTLSEQRTISFPESVVARRSFGTDSSVRH